MTAAPKLQPAPPKPPRSNARFWIFAGIAGVVLLLGSLVTGVHFYRESQAANIETLNRGLLGLGGDPPSENGNRRSLARLPTELPEGEPANQMYQPENRAPPDPPPQPPDLPPPTTPQQAEMQVAQQPQQPQQQVQAQAQPVERKSMLYRGRKKSEVVPASAAVENLGTQQGMTGSTYPRQAAPQMMQQPRNGRESFAQTAGRGTNIYARNDVVAPPLGMCVSTPHNIWDLQFQAEVHTQFGAEFTVHVLTDVPGRIYDGVSSRACDYPLVPAGSQVACVPNTADVGRGDKFVQAVCSRVDFPGGYSMPLDGWSLVGPRRSAGVPANSKYPWGDIFASAVVDIIGAIPGAFVAAAGSLSGPAGVAINIGSDRFREATQSYGQNEFSRVPTLYVPQGAPAGLRQIGSLALPDEPR